MAEIKSVDDILNLDEKATLKDINDAINYLVDAKRDLNNAIGGLFNLKEQIINIGLRENELRVDIDKILKYIQDNAYKTN